MRANRKSALGLLFTAFAVLGLSSGCPSGSSGAASPAPPSPAPRPVVELEIPKAGDSRPARPAVDQVPAPAPPTKTASAEPANATVPEAAAPLRPASIDSPYPEIAKLVPAPKERADRARVEKVVDGDTVTLEDGTKVRLIGINTPETGTPMAEEARQALSALVRGKEVLLESDVERRDMYKRRLAYIYVDGRFVNGEMVRRGFAHVYRWEPNVKYAEPLLTLQRAARKDGLGIWTLPAPAPAASYVTRAQDHIFHRPECSTARQIPEKQRIELGSREEAFDTGRKPHPQCNP